MKLRPSMQRACVALLVIYPLSAVALSDSQLPYIPSSPNTVLEHVSRQAKAGGDLRELQQALTRQPTDLPNAAKFARLAIERGVEEADPRYFGYAQAALQPWWTLPHPPPQAQLLRATILQWQHQFDPATRDLDAVIAADGFGVEQAHLTRASLELVRGDPEASRRDCITLIGRTETLIAATCIAAANAVMGRAATTEQSLRLAIEQTQGSSDSALVWAYTELGEISLQLGHRDDAERAFKAALNSMQRSGHRDPYLLAAYADALLDQARYAEVIALLSELTRIDNLLLRLALAEARSDAATAERSRVHTGDLQRRFAETRQRGDFVHQREEAMMLLELLHDPKAAVTAASDNWTVQKELIDARTLLAAARAANNREAAAPVESWIDRYHVEDVRLRPTDTGTH